MGPHRILHRCRGSNPISPEIGFINIGLVRCCPTQWAVHHHGITSHMAAGVKPVLLGCDGDVRASRGGGAPGWSIQRDRVLGAGQGWAGLSGRQTCPGLAGQVLRKERAGAAPALLPAAAASHHQRDPSDRPWDPPARLGWGTGDKSGRALRGCRGCQPRSRACPCFPETPGSSGLKIIKKRMTRANRKQQA